MQVNELFFIGINHFLKLKTIEEKPDKALNILIDFIFKELFVHYFGECLSETKNTGLVILPKEEFPASLNVRHTLSILS